MTKSALVKIGVPSEQADGMRLHRRIRQILEQHDMAVTRLTAATNEKIREAVAAGVPLGASPLDHAEETPPVEAAV